MMIIMLMTDGDDVDVDYMMMMRGAGSEIRYLHLIYCHSTRINVFNVYIYFVYY